MICKINTDTYHIIFMLKTSSYFRLKYSVHKKYMYMIAKK